MWESKNRRSWLCKTPQTEKNQTLGIFHIQKREKSCKKSKKQEASKKTHTTLVPPSHLYLMAFLSVHVFKEPHTAQQLRPLTSSICQQGSASSQDRCAFHCSPAINNGPVRSTLFSYTATFLLPLDKCPNIQIISCHTIKSACTSQSLT